MHSIKHEKSFQLYMHTRYCIKQHYSISVWRVSSWWTSKHLTYNVKTDYKVVSCGEVQKVVFHHVPVEQISIIINYLHASWHWLSTDCIEDASHASFSQPSNYYLYSTAYSNQGVICYQWKPYHPPHNCLGHCLIVFLGKINWCAINHCACMLFEDKPRSIVEVNSFEYKLFLPYNSKINVHVLFFSHFALSLSVVLLSICLSIHVSANKWYFWHAWGPPSKPQEVPPPIR